MALVFTARVGDDFYVGDRRYRIISIAAGTKGRLRDEGTGDIHDLSERRATEVEAAVWVSVGAPRGRREITLAIATANKHVQRGKTYRAVTEEC